jgi:outer membrane protein assembly factor BamA
MPLVKKYKILLIIFCFLQINGWSQPVLKNPDTPAAIFLPKAIDSLGSNFVVGEIFIEGNRITKPYIIERELPFKTGDSVYLPDLVARFRRAKELLINTRLFTDVVVSLKSFRGYQVDILIEVKERWYIFPLPYFKPVDRNLSAWADNKYSLSRVNYGLKFAHNNFTGRNDKLRLWLITGYTRQIQLNYDQPYANKSLTKGFGASVSYAALKEINLFTNLDKQVFLNADSLHYSGRYLIEQFSGSLSYFYRPALKTRHSFRLSVNNIHLDSAVLQQNPYYFNNTNRWLFYPEFNYTVEYQNADYVPYLLRGFMGDINFVKRGIDANMNLWQITGRFTKGWATGHKTYLGFQGYGTIKLPLDQPFYNQRIFGYGDIYLRGLERYVIDGTAGAMLRTTFRKQIYSFNFNFFNIPTLENVPIKIYAKAYGDLGYSYNRNFLQNTLVNQLLYTKGLGIDVVTLYDLVVRFEYSFNQLGQSGFFFHIRNDF